MITLLICVQLVLPADSLIFNSDIIYKDVAIAIARHETGNYTSKAYHNKNNLFGFKRKSVLRYKSKQLSVIAYQDFEKRVILKYKITTQKQYLNRISKFYAKNKQWKKHITTNLSKVNSGQ